jgi:ABC-type branched-subunit amino acid transport system substrate-binding protein
LKEGNLNYRCPAAPRRQGLEWCRFEEQLQREEIMGKRFFLFAVAGLLFLWAIPQMAAAQDEVVIGIPLAIPGARAKFGEQHKNGYTMALEEVLAQGGIHPHGRAQGEKIKFPL